MWTPTDIGSSALFSPGLKLAQYGLVAPAPGSAAFMVSPAEVTTRTSRPRDRNPVARLHDRVSRLGVELRVGLGQKLVGGGRRLDVSRHDR